MSNARDKILEFQCPKCARRLKASAQAAGKRLKCPGCGQPVKVPGSAADAAADDDWLQLDAPSPAPATPTAPAALPAGAKPVAKPASSSASESASSPIPKSAPPSPGKPASAPGSMSGSAPESAAKPLAGSTAGNRGAPTDDAAAAVDEAAKDEAAVDKAVGAEAASPPKQRAASIFDEDLPELAELEAPRPRASLDALLGADTLDALMAPTAPPSSARPGAARPPDASKPAASKSTATNPPATRPTTSRSEANKPDATKPAGNSSGAKSKESKKAVVLDPAQQQYRVPCPSCGTPQYVTVAMKGRPIRCPDCFLEFKIPPPPPNWKPSDKAAHTKWGTALAEQPPGEAERDAARARSQADDYLRRAEQELADEEIDSLYQGDFDTQSFVNRTFGFFFDSAALFQVVLYSAIFAMLFSVAQWCALKIAEGDKGVVLMLGLAVLLLFIITAFPMFGAAMTMLESVANGQRKVTEWPGFSFFDHIGELLLFGVALAAAAIPGFLIGGFIGRSGGMAWMVIFGTMLTTFLTFPIILLSMLDNESIFNPVSPDVLKSLSSGYEAWGVFYFKTFVAYSVVFIAWCILFGGHPILTGLAGALIPWLVFFTSQQLGVLAMDISEQLALPLGEDEPKKSGESEEEEIITPRR